jgi:predicted  nucleic acid-binding Zn-ribbon protein
MYIYVYVYICVCIYMHVDIYIYIYTCNLPADNRESDGESASISAALTAAHGEAQRLREERAAIEGELAGVRDECELRKDECEQLVVVKEDVKVLQQQLASATEECAAHRDKCVSIQNVCASLKSEMEAVLSESETLHQQYDTLKRKMHSTDALAQALINAAPAAQLRNELQQLSDMGAEAGGVFAVSALRIVALEEKLDKVDEELRSLRKHVDSQNAEALQLQSLLEEVNEFVEGQAAKMCQHECDVSSVLDFDMSPARSPPPSSSRTHATSPMAAAPLAATATATCAVRDVIVAADSTSCLVASAQGGGEGGGNAGGLITTDLVSGAQECKKDAEEQTRTQVEPKVSPRNALAASHWRHNRW